MTEPGVVSSVAGWLKSGDWSVPRANCKARGWDIEAKKNGESWFIHAKGDARNDRPNQDTNFYCALGQVLAGRKDANAKCSVAFPDVSHYRSRWQQLPAAAKSVVNSCLFVSDDKSVSECT